MFCTLPVHFRGLLGPQQGWGCSRAGAAAGLVLQQGWGCSRVGAAAGLGLQQA